ncbi:MAG: HEAT repeat domain-containing protein [Phycisphaeraceae bacterium]|nr:HEAT repeat domain-containing protein [Phycisphaeraceae bacterium]MCW5763926.1 HEAT repeat domain-containing protein [Phycisphaeraceae bacterium]
MPSSSRISPRSMILLAGLALTLVAPTGCTTTKPRAKDQSATEPQAIAQRDPVALSQLREQALDELVTAASSEYAQERANALEGLLYAPSRLQPIAAMALMDSNEGVRSIAAMVVGRARLAELTPALRTLLHDQSPFVVASAIYALDRNGAAVDPTPLGRFLFDSASMKVRAHAAYVLGELGHASALPMLADAARATSSSGSSVEHRLLELQIAEAMIKLGDRTKLDSIRSALLPASADELEATALAAQIIGTVGDRESAKVLIWLSAQQDQRGNAMPPEVLLSITGALAELKVRGGSQMPDRFLTHANPAVRAQAAFVYGQIAQRENLSRLETLLDDESGLVRVAAATATLRVLASSQNR